MQVIRSIGLLKNSIQSALNNSKKIGFVPTMGALHRGHIALVKAAKEKCDVVVCSIFVNPTQFNNPSDLEKYPRTEEKDLELLLIEQCDIVFIPKIEEIYPNFPDKTTFIDIDLAPLDQVMEGKSRPGHFLGVANIVFKLFDIVQPHYAFFGQKDFQQVCIIEHMIQQLNLPVKLVALPTQREPSGLAMSSRNMRLSTEQAKKAAMIYETLVFGKKTASTHTPKATQTKMIEAFKKSALRLDYLEIVHPKTLVPLSEDWVSGAVVCIAAYCGEVRLIDNMVIID